MIKKYLIKFALLMLIINLYTCDRDNPSNPYNNYVPPTEWLTRKVDISVSHTNYPPNEYRPLGFDPIPLTIQPIFDQFINTGANFEQLNKFDRILPTGYDASYLEYGNYKQYVLFINYYLVANGINPNITKEPYYIHLFGVYYCKYVDPNVFGFSAGLGLYGWDIPGSAWVLPGRIDSSLKAKNPSYNDDQRKKYITLASGHELMHARGLTDLKGQQDQVHYYHSTEYSWCNMQYFQTLNYDEINNRYPPKLCENHKKLVRDSLWNKIKSTLYISDN